MRNREPAVDFGLLRVLGSEEFVELVLGVDDAGVFGPIGFGSFKQRTLDFVQDPGDGFDELGALDALFFLVRFVSASHEHGIVRHVARADLDADGHAFLDPRPELVAALDVAVVQLDFDRSAVESAGFQFVADLSAVIQHRLWVLSLEGDGDDDDMRGRQLRREDQAVVVGMGHDQAADQSGRNAPAGGPGVNALAVLVEEHDVLRLGEVLAEEVAGPGLEGFSVLHHGFDGVGIDGAGEAFAGGFFTLDDRHRHDVLGKVGVDLEHPACFFDRFFLRGVGGVTFLPEELGGPQEQACAHLPTDHVRPLIDQQGQVAVAFDPLREAVADDGLRGRTDDERFFEFAGGLEAALPIVFETVVCDDRALLGESLHVLGFFFQEALGDEQREVGVAVAGVFETLVERALDVFPDGVAPGLDHHASAHRGSLGQVGGTHHLLVPLGVVFGSCRGDGGLGFLAHTAGR